jgi:hypothetical protein
VRPALKRQHASVEEGELEVRRLQATLRLEGDDPLKDLGHVRARAGERGDPAVALARPTRVEGGQVDMVNALLQILHIEEGALSFLARLFPLQL